MTAARSAPASAPDLAPWVAETLERISRDPATPRGEEGMKAALSEALAESPRAVSTEELLRGSAIALELMAAEAIERIRAVAEPLRA